MDTRCNRRPSAVLKDPSQQCCVVLCSIALENAAAAQPLFDTQSDNPVGGDALAHSMEQSHFGCLAASIDQSRRASRAPKQAHKASGSNCLVTVVTRFIARPPARANWVDIHPGCPKKETHSNCDLRHPIKTSNCLKCIVPSISMTCPIYKTYNETTQCHVVVDIRRQ